jgi:hypothetical protein
MLCAVETWVSADFEKCAYGGGMSHSSVFWRKQLNASEDYFCEWYGQE